MLSILKKIFGIHIDLIPKIKHSRLKHSIIIIELMIKGIIIGNISKDHTLINFRLILTNILTLRNISRGERSLGSCSNSSLEFY